MKVLITGASGFIKETNGGLVAEPGDYGSVEKNLRWFIENADNPEVKAMGKRGHDYLVKYLTKDMAVGMYKDIILEM